MWISWIQTEFITLALQIITRTVKSTIIYPFCHQQYAFCHSTTRYFMMYALLSIEPVESEFHKKVLSQPQIQNIICQIIPTETFNSQSRNLNLLSTCYQAGNWFSPQWSWKREVKVHLPQLCCCNLHPQHPAPISSHSRQMTKMTGPNELLLIGIYNRYYKSDS